MIHAPLKTIPALPIHKDLLNQLMRASKGHWGYDGDFMDAFMEKFGLTTPLLEDENVSITMAYKKDDLVGFYGFTRTQDDSIELDWLFLDPLFIGQGLGRELWTMACATALERDYKEFTLWSDPGAEGFYTRMGCEKVGTRPSPMLPNRFPPIMKYVLGMSSHP